MLGCRRLWWGKWRRLLHMPRDRGWCNRHACCRRWCLGSGLGSSSLLRKVSLAASLANRIRIFTGAQILLIIVVAVKAAK